MNDEQRAQLTKLIEKPAGRGFDITKPPARPDLPAPHEAPNMNKLPAYLYLQHPRTGRLVWVDRKRAEYLMKWEGFKLPESTPASPEKAPQSTPATLSHAEEETPEKGSYEAGAGMDLDGLSYRDLQALAKELGLKASGSAADIKERILSEG